MRLDRFSLQNGATAWIELASEEEAEKAFKSLNAIEFMDSNLVVQPLKEDFVFGAAKDLKDNGRKPVYLFDGPGAARDALKPLLEGRRLLLSVQTPGWGEHGNSRSHNVIALKNIEENLGEYGIECIGGLAPFFGDKKPLPRMLCHLDFTTKRGAEQALAAVHKTEIDGRLVWLQQSTLSPWKAHRIGKIDQALLAELQEKGHVKNNYGGSDKLWEDKFVKSDQKRGRENSNTTKWERTQKRQAAQEAE
jgi:hypothetical protein